MAPARVRRKAASIPCVRETSSAQPSATMANRVGSFLAISTPPLSCGLRSGIGSFLRAGPRLRELQLVPGGGPLGAGGGFADVRAGHFVPLIHPGAPVLNDG